MSEEKHEIGVRMANIYRRQWKTKEALEQLEKLIKDHPNLSGGYTEKAGILADLGQHDLALENINLAIKLSPKDKKLIDFRAELINFLTS